MDILYYSNHCSNSQKVIQYIAKFGLIDTINAVCIDKRSIDNVSGQVLVQLENGKKIMLPPNVHSVPAMLIVKNNYSAIFGQDIIRYFEPVAREKLEQAHQNNGEPIGISLAPSSSGVAIMSEQYTLYNLEPDDLSAKSRSEKRPMYNYVSASHEPYKISTPPDTYRPDKIGESVSIETLTQKRNNDISSGGVVSPFGF
jgi:hypothetical protein